MNLLCLFNKEDIQCTLHFDTDSIKSNVRYNIHVGTNTAIRRTLEKLKCYPLSGAQNI